MKMLTKIFSLAGLSLLLFASSVTAQDAAEIIRKMDAQLRGSSSKAEMTIQIIRPKWERTMRMRAWAKGDDYAMIVIDEPTKEKGTVFLKREKELWNWVPRISRTIKLPASMMSQSWMGTDMSNDELVRQSSLVKDFDHKILGEETLLGKDCYIIELRPKPNTAVVWGKVVMWVTKSGYIQMKVEQFDEDDYLVNTGITISTKKFGSNELPERIEIVPADNPGQKTIMQYIDLQFNIPIEEDFFSIQNMKRIR